MINAVCEVLKLAIHQFARSPDGPIAPNDAQTVAVALAGRNHYSPDVSTVFLVLIKLLSL